MITCINKINGIRCKNDAITGDVYCEKCKCEIKASNERDDVQYRIGKIVRGALRSEKMFDIDRLK